MTVDFTVRDFALLFLSLLLLPCLPRDYPRQSVQSRARVDFIKHVVLFSTICNNPRRWHPRTNRGQIFAHPQPHQRAVFYTRSVAPTAYDHSRLSKPTLSSLFACASTQSHKTENLESATTNFVSFLRIPAAAITDTVILAECLNATFGLNWSIFLPRSLASTSHRLFSRVGSLFPLDHF